MRPERTSAGVFPSPPADDDDRHERGGREDALRLQKLAAHGEQRERGKRRVK
jgi:hypothetical protein